MNQKELKELIEFLIDKDISEFELERGDVKVKIKRRGETVTQVISAPVAPILAPIAAAPMAQASAGAHIPAAAAAATGGAGSAPAAPAEAEEDLHIVKSPIVGTFYEAPAPGAPPFIKPGDIVSAGQVLCIIEAMKLMNEIESDASGEIVKILAANGKPVEYGQPLFSIRARK
ncbi:MAG TPA: acetyl-CoA carboxylase biotin carboxyl carrier protein [Candidatus Limnocylindrales bacterium]|jgi:acetyl-CoA carboxylase biotin carboxyl carrier protein|nr:acetyl-CoA carboxylase biotin carboxyl carrier protein [Candidatus Limnocylindrales bacterium]